MNELIELVKQWGIDKGITGLQGKGTIQGQAEKMLEEAQETFDATLYSNEFEIRDGIGDTCVTLILLAEMYGWSLEECLQAAYDEIKGRTGVMSGGTFVKDK